ncbi:hypothetical protein KC317_g46 [Hortaea werneckii]|nr:hypothetical protein KC317_g46 [Hortaea werneckii]
MLLAVGAAESAAENRIPQCKNDLSFEEGVLRCVGMEGKILLETKRKVAVANVTGPEPLRRRGPFLFMMNLIHAVVCSSMPSSHVSVRSYMGAGHVPLTLESPTLESPSWLPIVFLLASAVLDSSSIARPLSYPQQPSDSPRGCQLLVVIHEVRGRRSGKVTVHPVGRMDSFAVAVWVERGMRWVWLVSISCSFVFALCVVLLNLAAASLPPRRMGTLVVLMFHGAPRARVDLDVSISLSFVELACRSLLACGMGWCVPCIANPPLLSYLSIVLAAVVVASSGCMRSEGEKDKGIGRFEICCARDLVGGRRKGLLALVKRVTAVMGGRSCIVILVVGRLVSLAATYRLLWSRRASSNVSSEHQEVSMGIPCLLVKSGKNMIPYKTIEATNEDKDVQKSNASEQYPSPVQKDHKPTPYRPIQPSPNPERTRQTPAGSYSDPLFDHWSGGTTTMPTTVSGYDSRYRGSEQRCVVISSNSRYVCYFFLIFSLYFSLSLAICRLSFIPAYAPWQYSTIFHPIFASRDVNLGPLSNLENMWF